MVGWAFQALSALFKFLTSSRKKQRDWRENPPSEIEGIFPMKCCAVTWNRLCLLCLLMSLAPFNQMLNDMHALAFTVRVGLQRISMPRWFQLCMQFLYLKLEVSYLCSDFCYAVRFSLLVVSVKRVANDIQLQYSVMSHACFPWWHANAKQTYAQLNLILFYLVMVKNMKLYKNCFVIVFCLFLFCFKKVQTTKLQTWKKMFTSVRRQLFQEYIHT